MKQVLAISRGRAEAVLSDDEVVPITSWIDADGPCDPRDAICCVAGPCSDGKWYSINLEEFDPIYIN